MLDIGLMVSEGDYASKIKALSWWNSSLELNMECSNLTNESSVVCHQSGFGNLMIAAICKFFGKLGIIIFPIAR